MSCVWQIYLELLIADTPIRQNWCKSWWSFTLVTNGTFPLVRWSGITDQKFLNLIWDIYQGLMFSKLLILNFNAKILRTIFSWNSQCFCNYDKLVDHCTINGCKISATTACAARCSSQNWSDNTNDKINTQTVPCSLPVGLGCTNLRFVNAMVLKNWRSLCCVDCCWMVGVRTELYIRRF